MKHFYFCLLFSLFTVALSAQEFKAEFWKYCEAQDTINQLKTLEAWKEGRPNDAELFTSYFNYHFQKARKEVLSLTKNDPQGQAYTIQDESGEKQGYLGSQIIFDNDELDKGLKIIDQGIALYPNRLDMRFGKVYAYGQIQNWQAFTSTLVDAISYTSVNDAAWTWEDNKPLDDGKDFLLSAVQDYMIQLFNVGDDSLATEMRAIAQAVLKIYPDNIPNLSNLANSYILEGQFDEALKHLLQAYKINPKDIVVINNIAHVYKLKKEGKRAIEFYEKLIALGSEEDIKFAQKQIDQIKNPE